MMMTMICKKYLIFIFCCLSLIEYTKSSLIQTIVCQFYECCYEPYVVKDFKQLEENLNKRLFGQPLVINTTVNALKAHYNLENPSKALVLSFHGVTGSGKNFVSEFVAKSLFKKGTDSRFYKYFSSARDFPHNERMNDYRERLINVIESTVNKCENSLFVFDEMDKIPIGLIDTIRAYIDFNKEIGGRDFRKSVFIFLSNSASKEIAERTLQLNLKNIERDQFELKTFQKSIYDHVYNHKTTNDKGMWHSSLISNHLIDHYIPFLPLERQHVKQCIISEFSKYSINENTYSSFQEDVDLIAEEMVYEPPGYNKYASSGCKRVANFVRKRIIEKRLKQDEL